MRMDQDGGKVYNRRAYAHRVRFSDDSQFTCSADVLVRLKVVYFVSTMLREEVGDGGSG